MAITGGIIAGYAFGTEAAVGVGVVAGGILASQTGSAPVTDAVMKGLTPKVPSIQMPTIPTVTPPTVMPTVDDAAVLAAQRNSMAQQMQRRGRASTIMTQPGGGDTLG